MITETQDQVDATLKHRTKKNTVDTMRNLWLLIGISLAGNCWGQNTKLLTSNPAPRVGAEIEITFDVEKADLTELEDKKKKSEDDYEALRANSVGQGSFKVTMSADTGTFDIGPFSLTVRGAVYTSDVLRLKVFPALPDDVKEGLWIRYTEFDGHGYLLLEQRVPNAPKREVTDQGFSVTMDSEGVAFAEPDKEKLEARGVKIVSSRATSSSQSVGDHNGDFYSNVVSFNEAAYKFELGPEFKGPLKIDKSFFKNFPDKDKVFMKDVVIRK